MTYCAGMHYLSHNQPAAVSHRTLKHPDHIFARDVIRAILVCCVVFSNQL